MRSDQDHGACGGVNLEVRQEAARPDNDVSAASEVNCKVPDVRRPLDVEVVVASLDREVKTGL